jgi:hypothetical protein
MPELIFKNGVYAKIGAGKDVFNPLGAGFLEPVYQEAFEFEFGNRQIPFIS